MPVADLADLAPGTHLCRFYVDQRELARAAATFVHSGLATGERVLYVASARRPAQVEASFQVHGVRVERALDAGQLVIRDLAGADGVQVLDLDQLEADYVAQSVRARADGLVGLRVAAEMGDAVSAFGSLDQLLRWEEMATRLHREIGISTVCQYDRRRLSAGDLDLIAAAHAGVAPADTRAPLAEFYSARGGVHLVGELDVSNTDRLVQVLEARLAVESVLWLDLAEVTFSDVGSLRRLFETVLSREAAELTIRNASAQVRRLLSLAGLQHPRVVVL